MSASIPLPGQHRPSGAGDESSADPDTVRTEVSSLLNQLTIESTDDGESEAVDSDALARDASLLDRAHEVLVRALTTVDKT
ncbi:hypothetical protein CH272_19175 [Rhodococcus sp. 05-340-1]|jgi:hypothetical protein|uniref:hypothetical protein n=1 Tax=unclassified Rhodococcus (in: high G+C Gram-positive bacteria) TaxID=192944 RepID=UPI000B9C1C6E|nr:MULTISPECIES: hypothetical protein [unclassified Rhodococcus (in: high G+C Gram-positive bacteria)]OZD73405.1 hypothetical protein CH271_00600 [Rhodococcus sp. 05-340-2]OZD74327.1 hypothetical protein CH272_19175 [Rhodococcus sp. 05-340-1]OZF27128.1 hypothetical protein CH295_21120 [Rhodococcus sp. 14-2483-1-2]